MSKRRKLVILIASGLVVVLLLAASVYPNASAFVSSKSNGQSTTRTDSAIISTVTNAGDYQVGNVKFIGQYLINLDGKLSALHLVQNQSKQTVPDYSISLISEKTVIKGSNTLSIMQGNVGSQKFTALSFSLSNRLYSENVTDVLIGLGNSTSYNLSILSIAFTPKLGPDLHLGNLLTTNSSSSLYYQLMNVQVGIMRLGMVDISSANATLTTLGIYYLESGFSLSTFIHMIPSSIKATPIGITGVVLYDGNLVDCLTELALFGFAGAELASEAIACFTGVGFGIPCVLLIIGINALPIGEAIALKYAC